MTRLDRIRYFYSLRKKNGDLPIFNSDWKVFSFGPQEIAEDRFFKQLLSTKEQGNEPYVPVYRLPAVDIDGFGSLWCNHHDGAA